MHELRYFQEIISLSNELDNLWREKCEMVLKKSVRSPEGLKIYFDGKEEWIFDFLPTKERASRIVAESCFSDFDVANMGKGMVKNVV